MATFQPKDYQRDCLERLSGYLKHAAVVGAASAFNNLDEIKVKYRPVPGWEKSRDLPYICLRVPTGGGKTLIAACAVGVVTRDFLQRENSVVLWLAPSNQIVDQTIKALKNRDHPYRQALDRDFGAGVTVMDIQESLYVTRGTLDGSTTLILATIQSLRVEDTENRKVYEQAGALQHHFVAPYAVLKAGLADAPDVDVYSLAHVLRSRRPIVIMDEAHNARSELSFTFLQRLDPSAIIEFTATPDQETNPSNVLYSVSAGRLKEEDMIKLPIRLVARPQWQQALEAAVLKRGELQQAATQERAATGEYIRPIVLVQAQSKAGQNPITVDVLRDSLLKDFNIPESEIVRATGEDGPLPDDILHESCRINYVLTIQKLREGWDCPFAYVLCSASNLSSKTAVEQTLGRILRMPRAHLKQHPALNQAYAFVTSQDFEQTAKNLTDTLVETMGFSVFEARQAIEKQEQLPWEEGLFAKSFSENVAESPTLAALPIELAEKVAFDAARGTLTYTGVAMPDSERAAIEAAFKTDEAKAAVHRLHLRSWNKPVYPAALGQKLAVPVLCVKRGNQLELFEDQHHEAPWKLGERDAALSEAEWSPSATMAKFGLVDVKKSGELSFTPGEVQYIRELRGQMMLHETRGPKTAAQLAAWMDGAIENRWVTSGDKMQFLTRLVRHLLEDRKLTLPDVLASRFTLVDAAAEKVKQHCKSAAKTQYNLLLLPDAVSPLVVDPGMVFPFPLSQYPVPVIYSGPITYPKHYYKLPADMNGDEARCAAEIDKHPRVQYWVRNLKRPDVAFWLQTSTDKFYPDFVALLQDGRIAVIEFKANKDVSNDDSKEKKAIGETWAARSNGACLFTMVTEKNYASIVPSLLAS